MNTNKLVLGILGGIAAGAIVGILFAPAKGCKTRKRMINKGKDYADDLKEKFEDLYQEVADKYKNVIEETNEMISEKK
jgi:gas vesicle protein